MKFFKMFGKKKVAGVVLAGGLALGSLGGVAYASSDTIAGLIQNGIDKLYTAVFPQIDNVAVEKKDSIITQISTDVQSTVADAIKTVVGYKDELIDQNNKELDNYYDGKKKEIEQGKHRVVDETKKKLKTKADKDLQDSKDAIDAAIQSELSKAIKDENKGK